MGEFIPVQDEADRFASSDGLQQIDSGEYSVGYKRPPKEHRFKKGHAGYARRRKPKPSFQARLKQKLFTKVTCKLDGESVTTELIDVIVHQFLRKVVAGDAPARRDLLALVDKYPELIREAYNPPTITSDMSAKEAVEALTATIAADKI